MKPKKLIPPMKVHFSAGDRREILSRIDHCLETGFVAQGKNVEELETRFAEYIGCRHALALSSGGSALEAAMWALDVRGKEVLITTNTFFATAAAVLGAGGTVKLLDLDPDTLSPSVDMIDAALGPSTAGVIVVHIGGIMTRDMAEIRSLCERRGVWLFEDCAHAHGSAIGDRKAGLFGIGGAYSFFSTKVITSGEGGMLVTDDDGLAERVRLLRNYGKPNPWETYSTAFGLNWKLNELAAIVGVAQLKRLDELIEWRQRIAARYTDRLALASDLKAILPCGRCSWYKYIVLLPPGVDKATVKEFAKRQGVALSGGVYDIPLHQQPIAADLAAAGDFPNAEDFCRRHICLPIFYGMTDDEADFVIETVSEAVVQA